MPHDFMMFVGLGAAFGLMAAACAFVIAYGENRQRFPGRRKPAGMALQTAFVAFLFFFLLSVIVPWALQLSTKHAAR